MKIIRCSLKVGVILCCLILAAALASVGSAQTRDPLPVPGVPGYKTLKGDFHLHTVISDGEVWPTTRLAEAWRDGLDAIAVTDHSDYNPHKDDVKVDLGRSFELLRSSAERLGMILIPGIEVAEGDTHCNALFIKDPNALRGAKLIEALQRAHSQDAFVFWNHPGWKQTAEWFPLIAAAYDQKLIQGMELVNGDSFYPEAYPWVEQRKLTIMADSDEHAPMSPAEAGSTRPITLLFVKSADAGGVREALFERRTAAWMGGEVWGAESFLAGLWKGAIKVENPEVTIRAGSGSAALRLRNESAFPFKLRVSRIPAWLRGLNSTAQMRRQSILAVPVSGSKNAPPGSQRVEIELEVTNFHIGPGKNLTVTLPVAVNVTQ